MCKKQRNFILQKYHNRHVFSMTLGCKNDRERMKYNHIHCTLS